MTKPACAFAVASVVVVANALVGCSGSSSEKTRTSTAAVVASSGSSAAGPSTGNTATTEPRTSERPTSDPVSSVPGSRSPETTPNVRTSGRAELPSGSSSSSSTSSSPQQSPSDDAKLDGVLLKKSDFGGNYTGRPDTGSDDTAGHAALVACAGGRNTSSDQTAEAKSNDFIAGGQTISSKAVRFGSSASIDADVALIKRTKFQACYAKLARAQFIADLPAGTKIDAVTVTVIPGSGGGPNNVAGNVEGRVTVTAQGQRVDLYFGTVLITGSKLEAQIELLRQNKPLSPKTVSRLTKLVAVRAAKA